MHLVGSCYTDISRCTVNKTLNLNNKCTLSADLCVLLIAVPDKTGVNCDNVVLQLVIDKLQTFVTHLLVTFYSHINMCVCTNRYREKSTKLEPLLGNSVNRRGTKNPSLFLSTVARIKEKHRSMFLKTTAQIMQQAHVRTLHRGGQRSDSVQKMFR